MEGACFFALWRSRSWPGWPGRCSARASSWSAACRSPGRTWSPGPRCCAAAGIRAGHAAHPDQHAAVARRVERLRQVQSAQVSRDWPDTVVISVQERTPALAVAGAGGFGLVDEFGVVVRVGHASSRPPCPLLTAPLARPSGPLRGSPAIRAAVIVLRELPRPARHRVRCWRASATAVTLQLGGGVRSSGAAPTGRPRRRGTVDPDAYARALLRRQRARHGGDPVS